MRVPLPGRDYFPPRVLIRGGPNTPPPANSLRRDREMPMIALPPRPLRGKGSLPWMARRMPA